MYLFEDITEHCNYVIYKQFFHDFFVDESFFMQKFIK